MASMIYGVSHNRKRGIGYVCDNENQNSFEENQPISPFTYLYPCAHTQKFNVAQKLKFIRNFGKTNSKGPKKLRVPKDKIVYVADTLCSGVKTPVMVPVVLPPKFILLILEP